MDAKLDREMGKGIGDTSRCEREFEKNGKLNENYLWT